MEKNSSYGQFCPVAMAAELVCTRWTPLVLRELLAGSTRFNDLRKGVPRMSPALLSTRLKELEDAGIIERRRDPDSSGHDYHLTQAGRDLWPVVEALGIWGQRWLETRVSLRNLDPSLLMWDMRRNLNPTPMPARRSTIQFLYPELQPSQQNWWLVVEPGVGTDLCASDPGFEVDLYVETDLRTMTAIWMGLATVEEEVRAGRLQLNGDGGLRRAMPRWLGLSVFARERKLAA
jgi:DNA-binding HxlR family transcriptional regulator